MSIRFFANFSLTRSLFLSIFVMSDAECLKAIFYFHSIFPVVVLNEEHLFCWCALPLGSYNVPFRMFKSIVAFISFRLLWCGIASFVCVFACVYVRKNVSVFCIYLNGRQIQPLPILKMWYKFYLVLLCSLSYPFSSSPFSSSFFFINVVVQVSF